VHQLAGVVARAGVNIHVLDAETLRRVANEIGTFVVKGDCGPQAFQPEVHFEGQGRGDIFAGNAHLAPDVGEQRIVRVSAVDAEIHLARNGVAGIGPQLEVTDGDHRVGLVLKGDVVDGVHHARRAHHGVAAHAHGEGAGVAFFSFYRDGEAALSLRA
jgi:hypothetical protein